MRYIRTYVNMTILMNKDRIIMIIIFIIIVDNATVGSQTAPVKKGLTIR